MNAPLRMLLGVAIIFALLALVGAAGIYHGFQRVRGKA